MSEKSEVPGQQAFPVELPEPAVPVKKSSIIHPQLARTSRKFEPALATEFPQKLIFFDSGTPIAVRFQDHYVFARLVDSIGYDKDIVERTGRQVQIPRLHRKLTEYKVGRMFVVSPLTKPQLETLLSQKVQEIHEKPEKIFTCKEGSLLYTPTRFERQRKVKETI